MFFWLSVSYFFSWFDWLFQKLMLLCFASAALFILVSLWINSLLTDNTTLNFRCWFFTQLFQCPFNKGAIGFIPMTQPLIRWKKIGFLKKKLKPLHLECRQNTSVYTFCQWRIFLAIQQFMVWFMPPIVHIFFLLACQTQLNKQRRSIKPIGTWIDPKFTFFI